MVVVAIFIEPAPYILDLLRVARQRNPDIQLRVYFISASLTQDWGSSLDDVAILLPASPWRALHILISDIVRGQFDVLHLAGWGNPLMLCSLIIGGLFRRRITIESDTQLPIGLVLWKRAIKRVLYPGLFAFADIVFPGGTRQKQYFLHYGVPERKIRIARMTVDVTRIIRQSDEARLDKPNLLAKWNLPKKAVLFLYVGRLNIHKGGIHDLVEAFAKLSHPKNAWLVIAGDGELREYVESSVSRNDRIIYLGRLSPEKVSELYALGDILVLASHSENWGLVVNEAMAAGLPVIVSNRVGCVDDLVLDGATGLIVPGCDVNKLSEAMSCLAENDQLRQLMGSAGRQHISTWRLEDEGDILSAEWRGLKLKTDDAL
jgi:glycosyltransferase involved in cell wall biosynthesis